MFVMSYREHGTPATYAEDAGSHTERTEDGTEGWGLYCHVININ